MGKNRFKKLQPWQIPRFLDEDFQNRILVFRRNVFVQRRRRRRRRVGRRRLVRRRFRLRRRCRDDRRLCKVVVELLLGLGVGGGGFGAT